MLWQDSHHPQEGQHQIKTFSTRILKKAFVRVFSPLASGELCSHHFYQNIYFVKYASLFQFSFLEREFFCQTDDQSHALESMSQMTSIELGKEDCQPEIAPSLFYFQKNMNPLNQCRINFGQKTDPNQNLTLRGSVFWPKLN